MNLKKKAERQTLFMHCKESQSGNNEPRKVFKQEKRGVDVKIWISMFSSREHRVKLDFQRL